MSGAIISFPANGASAWSAFPSIVVRHLRGHCQIAMDEMSAASVLEPKVQAGSSIEVGGSIYTFESEEGAATGWSAISSATNTYMKVVTSGTTCSIAFAATAPTWSSAKCGYYSDNDRYFAWVRKDSTAGYRYKHYLPQTFEDSIYFESEIAMGEWDMSATASIIRYHELAFADIRYVTGAIRDDDNTELYPIAFAGYLAGDVDIRINALSTTIYMARLATGHFDDANFDGTVSTVASRGWITIKHEM